MFIGKLIYSTFSTKSKIEKYQSLIRDYEWKSINSFIVSGSKFLDVGCGAGYAMYRAQNEKNCEIYGVDPSPGAHGVGRFEKDLFEKQNIIKGTAENLPFDSNSFEVVYSSHVLEHVDDELKSLKEMKRVLKDDGCLIIGMPTALMAWINLFSVIIFTTHIKVYEWLLNFYKKDSLKFFVKIFRVGSHSYPRSNSIWYDIKHYQIRKWRKLVEKEFEIVETIKPCLYPYPDFIQFFKLHKSKIGSSSVFFVCKKKK